MPKQKNKSKKIGRLGKNKQMSSSRLEKHIDINVNSIFRKIGKNWPIILVTLIAAILFMANLGNHYLWQDEAQTALIGETILNHGLPLGYDGKNFFSQEEGAEYGTNFIWRWHTWLQFYLPAVFFWIFGVNTFAARLPFVLFAIATVPLIYYFSRFLWKSDRAGLLAAILLTINVPFILLGRQCRYYSLSSFFCLAALYGYVRILEDKKYSQIVFILSATFLFHSLYIYCATLLAAILLHCLFFYRSKLFAVLKASLVILIINVPWIIWFSGINYGSQYPMPFSRSFDLIFSFLYSYTAQIFTYIFPFFFILILIAVWIINCFRQKRFTFPEAELGGKILLLILFVFINVALLSFISPASYFRYMAPIIPVFCVMMALILESSMKIHSVIAIVVLGITLYVSPMHDYIYEITHDYDGPIKGIVKYLNQHGKKEDVVLITYGDLPLKFYTDMRIVGGLTGEDLSPARNADWVIVRKYLGSHLAKRVDMYIAENISLEKYEPIVLNYPDIKYENREDPAEHHYRTVENEDRVVIFRKIK
jgi:hypothetical protein